MVQPFGNNVLIQPLAKEQQTSGGLILADTVKQILAKATVVAVGPGTKDLAMEAAVGDVVYYQPHPSDQVFKVDDVDSMLLHQTRLLAKAL